VLVAISKASSWGWGSPKTVALLAGGLALLGLWVIVERRTAEPLIDMRTMALGAVWRTNLAATLFGMGMFAAFSIVPEFVEQPRATGFGFGASVTGAGLFLMPAAVTMSLLGPLAGKVERRTGSKRGLIIGGACATTGYVLLAISHAVHWHLYAEMAIVGIGMGLGFAALPNLILNVVPHEQTGAATGINTIMRVLGGALGIQICATFIAQHVARPGGPPLSSGFDIAFWFCAAALAGASLAGSVVPREARWR
jgi:MFS family permease